MMDDLLREYLPIIIFLGLAIAIERFVFLNRARAQNRKRHSDE